MHYGTPPWLEGAFLHSDYTARVAEFAARVAQRWKGRIHLWTPLNEPRITAWFCGKVGVWPPARRGWRGFVAVLLPLCRGIVESNRALLSVDAENVLAHVDAANHWLSPQPAEPLLEELTQFRRELVFLGLDLITGRVAPGHPLWNWLLQHGASVPELEWFHERRVPLDVIGINCYPMLSQKQFVRTKSGRIRIRFPPGDAEMVERIAELYWERYRRPMFIAETAGRGTAARRMKWLRQSVAGVRRLRERGIPLIGYTWWPMFDLVAWSYRQGRGPLAGYIVPMGLYGLDRTTLDRTHTPLVDAYQALALGGASAVGPLNTVNFDHAETGNIQNRGAVSAQGRPAAGD